MYALDVRKVSVKRFPVLPAHSGDGIFEEIFFSYGWGRRRASIGVLRLENIWLIRNRNSVCL